MGTFTIGEARNKAQAVTLNKSARRVLDEATVAHTLGKPYDIFLSHAFSDAELIVGIKVMLESFGYTVYVDWIDDPQFDRANVTADTVKQLKERMNNCCSLVYATTPSSTYSKWMPWECGYIDGKIGRAAILPITASSLDEYKGQEYLGAYPYITKDDDKLGHLCLWVNESSSVYCKYDLWLKGNKPTAH